MIKITQVNTSSGEVVVRIQYDKDSQVFTVDVRKDELIERLKLVRKTLGRPITLTDAKQTIVALVNEVRAGKSPLPEDFNYADFIGVDLEV
jgi:hypothetical protein